MIRAADTDQNVNDLSEMANPKIRTTLERRGTNFGSKAAPANNES
jgi:hypothetical protein